jgi:hypothetical protein
VPGLAQRSGAGAAILARRGRNPYSLPIFSFWIALAIVLVTVIAPDGSASAAQLASAPGQKDAQHLVVAGSYQSGVVRDNYRATKRVVPAAIPAPGAGIPDPGTAQAIAYAMLQARGWGDDQYSCLVALWNRESNWNVYAHNTSSGAYGIPQALPGSKMATAGADWATNPKTQITWGLGYITARYGTPCGAWSAFQSKGWY